MTGDDARRLALALPETVEQDHHGRPSFRVAGRIFATLWDERTMNVMLDEPGIRTAVEDHPGWCSERWWGKRLAAVAVALDQAPPQGLSELLADAWEGKAPTRLTDRA
jgi:hypothetical protein